MSLKNPKKVFSAADVRLISGSLYEEREHRHVNVYVLERRHEDSLGEARWEQEERFRIPTPYKHSQFHPAENLIHRLVEQLNYFTAECDKFRKIESAARNYVARFLDDEQYAELLSSNDEARKELRELATLLGSELPKRPAKEGT